MQQQVTKRSRCKKEKQSRVHSSMSQQLKAWAIAGMKSTIRAALLRPATWRWLSVNIPFFWEKIEAAAKELFSLFSDF